MKKLFVLLVLLLCFSLRAAPVTNVYLQWTDTNNFKPAIVQVIQTNPLVTITIPAVTAMVYKVYFSTNLLLPVKNWPLWSSVAVINPTPSMLSTVIPTLSSAAFYTVTASDPYVGLESDFSTAVGVRATPSPVQTGIAPWTPPGP
jgi:hypothetical protein